MMRVVNCPNCGKNLHGNLTPSAEDIFDEFVDLVLLTLIWSLATCWLFDRIFGEQEGRE
jgi:hypothetical protein